MRVQVYPIKIDSHRDKFSLYLGGDFHKGANIDDDAIYRFFDAVSIDKEPLTRVGLMGDYIYSFPKNDKRNWGMEKRPNKGDVLRMYSEMRDLIKPIAPKVVGCLVGNHDDDWRRAENINFVNWMCAELQMPYCDYETYIRFKVVVKNKEGGSPGRKSHRNVDVILWHGDGNGGTVGGAVNSNRRPIQAFRLPHIIAMGHFHRLGMYHEEWLDINEKMLDCVQQDQYFVMTGGFQKGYEPPDSTYISRKMLAPVAMGGVKLEIQPFRNVGETDVLDVVLKEIR